MKKTVVAVTMGDPCGIGPEIVVQALAAQETRRQALCLVCGDRGVLQLAMQATGVSLRIHEIRSVQEAADEPGTLNLVSLPDTEPVDPACFEWGKVSAMGGRAAYAYIAAAVRLALEGSADAVCTAPVNKESLRAASVPYIGHTEIFGALTGSPAPLTMFETCGMRIFFLTRHLSLRKMLDEITQDNIVRCVKECQAALQRLGAGGQRMAVAGLNPHSGEHGLFGDEEVREIAPAVERLRQEGLDVEGPVSADSVFHLCAAGKYGSVLSLYHDQGHIAAKTLDFARTISITNGLPFLRTSVDHGTAFDIAGTGKASAVSMMEAIRLAAKYAPAFCRGAGQAAI